MSEIKTLKFPGDVEPREIVDAKAREDISKLSDEIANIPSGADGKSAYQYAVDGGYTGTEEEFAAKLAEEMPGALPNPNALTFTGAVEGSYDGSEALTVEISSGGGGASMTDDDILECLIGTDMLSAVKDVDGAILTDENSKILLM